MCKDNDHNYVAVDDKVGIERKKMGNRTQIWLAFVCSKCASIQQVHVSTWDAQKGTAH